MSSELDDGVSAVINKINELTGRTLKATTKAHAENISARLRDGFTTEQLIAVVEAKAAEWIGTKFESYITPSTLFAPKNFARYMAEADIAKKTMTAETVVSEYHDAFPGMPRVEYITRDTRAAVTEFCLKSGMNIDNLRGYFGYIKDSCSWVTDEKYRKDFRFIVNLETLSKAKNGILNNV